MRFLRHLRPVLWVSQTCAGRHTHRESTKKSSQNTRHEPWVESIQEICIKSNALQPRAAVVFGNATCVLLAANSVLSGLQKHQPGIKCDLIIRCYYSLSLGSFHYCFFVLAGSWLHLCYHSLMISVAKQVLWIENNHFVCRQCDESPGAACGRRIGGSILPLGNFGAFHWIKYVSWWAAEVFLGLLDEPCCYSRSIELLPFPAPVSGAEKWHKIIPNKIRTFSGYWQANTKIRTTNREKLGSWWL